MTAQFSFFTSVYLTELLGVKARDVKEMLENLREVPASCVYYHTHRFLQYHQLFSPEPPNDFAFWVTNSLQENILGEQLASIEIVEFKSINNLRNKFIRVIEDYLKQYNSISVAPSGRELYFMKSKSFILSTKYTASSLEEFYEVLKIIDLGALYFHVFEAKLRLEKSTNDFSFWIGTELGKKALAREIALLDPYTQTMDGLRRRILELVGKELAK